MLSGARYTCGSRPEIVDFSLIGWGRGRDGSFGTNCLSDHAVKELKECLQAVNKMGVWRCCCIAGI